MTLPDFNAAEVAGRTVLVRADLDLPMHGGRVLDRTRLLRLAPVVRTLRRRNARVVLMGHFGDPRGVANPVLSLAPVALALSHELGHAVTFVADCIGARAEQAVGSLPAGGVAMLENLKFHQGEEQDDRSFALLLSVNGDLYVNNAPSIAGRSHASTHAILPLLPSFAGPALMAQRAGSGTRPKTLEEC